VYKIFRVEILPGSAGNREHAWTTDNKTYLHFRTSDGWVAITDLQPEGRRRMSAREFFRGNQI
jgi:methionyl-tRNA formyltransferase